MTAFLLHAAVRLLGRMRNLALLPLGLQQVERLLPPGEAGYHALLALARDPVWVGRYLAARRLGEHYGRAVDRVWQTLLALARDPERTVREGTAWSFAQILASHSDGAWPQVEALFLDQGTPDPFVRRAVLYAAAPLLRAGDPHAQCIALRLVELGATRDRTGATRQLGALLVGREMAVHAVTQAVALVERWAADPDAGLRWQAARALTPPLVMAAPERARAIAERLSGSSDRRVLSALRGAVRRAPELELAPALADAHQVVT